MQLPEFENKYELEISSYLIGDHIDESYIFMPTILILDKYFNQTRIITENVFEQFKPSFSEIASETCGIRVAVKGKISFNKDNDEDKYLIFYIPKTAHYNQI